MSALLVNVARRLAIQTSCVHENPKLYAENYPTAIIEKQRVQTFEGKFSAVL